MWRSGLLDGARSVACGAEKRLPRDRKENRNAVHVYIAEKRKSLHGFDEWTRLQGCEDV